MVKHKSRLKEMRQGTGLTIPSSVLVELAKRQIALLVQIGDN